MKDKLIKQKQKPKNYDPDLDLLFKKTIRILMKRILNTAYTNTFVTLLHFCLFSWVLSIT